MSTLTNHVNEMADRVHEVRSSQDRTLVAIAGAPGSGKSTLAEALARRLNLQKCPCIVVPMDGFHLDNAILDARNLRQVKGAPETFDGHGFVRMIKALKDKDDVIFPTYDRARDMSIAGAIAIPPDCPVIIIEGNYLMFDEAPWAALAPLWDLSARLDVPMPELRARLIQRWLSLNHSRAAATRRAEGNDIPNAQRVIDRAIPCDITLDGQPQA